MGVREVIEKIKNLEIQGATNIAKESCKALYKEIEKGAKKEEILKDYHDLINSRPNEPLMQNLLTYLVMKYFEGENAKDILDFCLRYIERSYERIPTFVYGLVDDGFKIGTICHSSLVEKAIKYIHDQGKRIEVLVPETRPKYQGRITAKKLSEYGIKVKLFVDGEIWRVVKESDIIFVGADVLLPNGIINKVGTKTMAMMSDLMDTEFFVLAQLLKFRARFEWGFPERIEMRNPREIWDYENENLEIMNYAFDFVEKKYISGIVSEEGIFSYEIIRWVVEKRYPWLFEVYF